MQCKSAVFAFGFAKVVSQAWICLLLTNPFTFRSGMPSLEACALAKIRSSEPGGGPEGAAVPFGCETRTSLRQKHLDTESNMQFEDHMYEFVCSPCSAPSRISSSMYHAWSSRSREFATLLCVFCFVDYSKRLAKLLPDESASKLHTRSRSRPGCKEISEYKGEALRQWLLGRR